MRRLLVSGGFLQSSGGEPSLKQAVAVVGCRELQRTSECFLTPSFDVVSSFGARESSSCGAFLYGALDRRFSSPSVALQD